VNGHALEEWLTASGLSFIEVRNLLASFLLLENICAAFEDSALFSHYEV
jgi:hypothetical protein